LIQCPSPMGQDLFFPSDLLLSPKWARPVIVHRLDGESGVLRRLDIIQRTV
jgi:hypothetical protein